MKISRLEAKEEIEDDILKEIADSLKIPVAAIKNFSEDAAISYINTFYDNSSNANNYKCTINPIDKLVETMERNQQLYERLLQSERARIELLEKMLQEKK